MTINTQSKFLTLDEVLKAINDDITLIQPGNTFRYAAGSALDEVFYYAFDPAKKWLLPEGVPPFKPSNVASGHSLCDLFVSIRRGRLQYFTYKNLQPSKREQLFIEMLEVLSEPEVKVLLAIKEQNLQSLFPNITPEALQQAGYLAGVELPQKKVKKQTFTKSKNGRFVSKKKAAESATSTESV